jgi:hypothetical protein
MDRFVGSGIGVHAFISMYGQQSTTVDLDAGKREKFRLSYYSNAT